MCSKTLEKNPVSGFFSSISFICTSSGSLTVSLVFYFSYTGLQRDILKETKRFIGYVYKIERAVIENISTYRDFRPKADESRLRRYLLPYHLRLADKLKAVRVTDDKTLAELKSEGQLTDLDVAALVDIGWQLASPAIPLRPGDADQDGDFDQLDIVKVLQAAKYLTGMPATWGEGDWDGAPGGSPGDPPLGDGVFNFNDILAALRDSPTLQVILRQTRPAADLPPVSPYKVMPEEKIEVKKRAESESILLTADELINSLKQG